MSDNPIFEEQTRLTFRVDTGLTGTAFSAVESGWLKYYKVENAATGKWSLSTSDATLGYMTYSVLLTGDLYMGGSGGQIRFQSKLKFSDDTEALGKVVTKHIRPKPW